MDFFPEFLHVLIYLHQMIQYQQINFVVFFQLQHLNKKKINERKN